MKRHILFRITTTCALLSAPVFADAGDWMAPDHGYVITTSTPNGIPQQSGQPARISGTIQLRGAHKECDSDKEKGSNEDLLSRLKEDGVTIKATFPDQTTDVTPALSLIPGGCSVIQFSYSTPNLNSSDLNVFGIQVLHLSDDILALEQIQSKLDKRAQLLSAIIAGQSGKPSKDLEQDIKALQNIQNRLQAVSAKITAKLQSQPQVLAQQNFALQVDNRVAAGSLNSTVSNHFRLAIAYALGSAIDGEKTQVTSTITRLGEKDDDENDDSSDLWVATFNWNSGQVNQTAPQAIGGGASLSFTFNTPKLWAKDAPNTFSVKLNAWEQDDDNSTGGSLGKEFGNLSFVEPVAVDHVPPTWNLATATPDALHPYVQNMQPIFAVVTDSFGLVDPQGFVAKLVGTQVDGTAVKRDVTSSLRFSSPDQGQTYQAAGDLNPIPEGLYTFSIHAQDLAGNAAQPDPLSAQFRVDRTPPKIILGVQDHYLTNNPSWALPITIDDLSPTTTIVMQNGSEVARFTSAVDNVAVTLKEGLNLFEISSVDAAGNQATPIQLVDIVLDTIPPVISNLMPGNGAIVQFLTFPVSGQSNEALSYAKVNGAPLTLSADKKSFSGAFSVPSEGPITLTWTAADLAGNITVQNSTAQVVLKVLNGDLISVVPDPDGLHFHIHGAPGATRPGLTVSANASIFNTGSATGGSDGSFDIQLLVFSQATVSATDPSLGRTDTTTVSYITAGPFLAGSVRDSTDSPLAGVTIIIQGTNLRTTTDGSGVFKFDQPVTGDQTLIVDGSTATLDPNSATPRKFSKTKIAITIGASQNSVIERPIYLVGIPTNGSVPSYDPTQQTSITSSAAPGVSLTISANSASFPDGTKPNQIYAETLLATVATISPPEFSQPKHVVAFEPSGLIFSAPATLTIPNVDNLLPGTNVVIMSMNSGKGKWEIDGAGEVTADGQSITTKPGMGITHFSVVYASPLGPKVAARGAADVPGADTFNGALSTAISLPSYKALGQDLAPTLLYRSSWARPTVLVSNIFNLPRATVYLGNFQAGSGYGTFSRVESDTTFTLHSQPNFLKANLSTTGLTTGWLTMDGATLPENALVSMALEMRDPSTGEFFQSKIYPFIAQYQVEYRETIVATTHYRKFRWWHIVEESTFDTTLQDTTNEAFPPDLTGPIFVQNESHSVAGAGWKIAGPQRIVNPTENQVMIEESDGSISTFALNNVIETLYNANGTDVNLTQGVDLNNWPKAFVSGNSQNLYRLDLGLGTIDTTVAPMFGFGGVIAGNYFWNENWDNFDHDEGSYCNRGYRPYNINSFVNGLLALPDGTMFGTDQNRHLVFEAANGSSWNLVGNTGNVGPTYNGPGNLFCKGPPWYCIDSYNIPHDVGQEFLSAIDSQIVNLCKNQPGMTCGNLQWLYYPSQNYGSCGTPWASNGVFPAPGNNGDGSLAAGNTIYMNAPRGVSAGPRPNTIVVADYGNHRVRLIDLSANTISTIAGNGNPGYLGDGDFATNAMLYHPIGVVYDPAGNLYISTEDGRIRVVDSTNRISTLAGALGATPGDNLPASQVMLSQPYGMVVDRINGFLYVADRGAHSVRKIDLQTKTISTVAGKLNTPGFNGDGIPALEANLLSPTWLGLDSQNNLLIVDSGNSRIRRVTFQNISGGNLAFGSSVHFSERLARDSTGNWARTYRNGLVVAFDPQGRQTSSLDLAQRQILYGYDPSTGALAYMQDPTGRRTVYQYAAGRLSSITDPANRQTVFSYDSLGELQQVTFPDGTSRTFGYQNGLMVSETNERQITTVYTYNQWNRLASVSRAYGTPDVTTITVNDSGSATLANNFTGGNVGTLQSAGQASDSVKDPKSVETKFTKDGNGYISTIVDSENNTTTIERNVKGLPTHIKKTGPQSAVLAETIFNYDPVTFDILNQQDLVSGVSQSYTYDVLGNVVANTNPRNLLSTAAYDITTDLLMSKTDPAGHSIRYTYYPLGLVASVSQDLTPAKAATTVVTYDSLGNKKSVTDPLNHVTTFDLYDSAGNLKQVTNAKTQSTCHDYDLFNRIIAAREACGTTNEKKTTYSYLPTGELASVQDSLGNITSYSYDSLGRLKTKTDPLNFKTNYTYDANGNLLSEQDANGNIKNYSYDNSNRLTGKTLPDNIISIAYDDHGRMINAINQQSQVDLGYDSANRLIATTATGLGTNAAAPVTISFGYDLNGNRTSLGDPSGTTSYIYYDDDLLKTLTDSSGHLFTFAFDSAHRMTSLNRPGSVTTLSFDDTSFLTSIIHNAGTSTLASFAYVPDAIGNRTQVTLAGSIAKNFGYDQFNQLTSASNPEVSGSLANESFNYDSVYNRTTDQDGGYTYDSKSQRLNEDYRYFYFYDNNGNLISKQAKGLTGEVTNYGYSSENQLLSFKVYVPGSTSPTKEVTYVYDALGRRIGKQVVDHTAKSDPLKTFSRRYVYDGQEILLEYDGANALLAHYTHSLLRTDDVLAVDVTPAGQNAKLAQNPGSYFYLKDGLGSVTDIADGNGNTIQHYIYSAFGELLGIKDAMANDVTSAPPITTSYSFTGREYDRESGLYYYRARYYDSGSGRFLQKDPDAGGVFTPITAVNYYVYAQNSPFVYTDPTGRFSIGAVFDGVIGNFAPIFSGILGGAVGFQQSRKEGGNTLQVIASTVVGAIIGAGIAIADSALIGAAIELGPIGIPVAVVGLAAIGAVGGALENLANQSIYHSSSHPFSWRRVENAAYSGAVSNLIGGSLGYVAGLAVSTPGAPGQSSLLGGLVGGLNFAKCADTGISSNDPNEGHCFSGSAGGSF